jgi:hypothetical protein
MAIVVRGIASVEVGDSAGKLASASQRVSEADTKLYVAAANQAARDATDVGLLLITMLDMTAAHGSNHYKKWGIDLAYINDAFTYQDKDDQIYNSNKLKVTYQTTNGGIPTRESVYIPQRRGDFTMADDGVSVVIGTSGPAFDYVTDLVATGLSSFGTAITSVESITVNDD